MHEVTASEAATLLSVLSKDSGGETPENVPSAIPASTYFATRRRVYEAGWLADRYVPDPWAVGVRAVDCVLVRPSPADRARWEREWALSTENVVLWSGLNILFGIFFRWAGGATRAEIGTTLSISADSGSVPVYFDYSRPWSRFIRVERETGYPRSVGGSPRPDGRGTLSGVSELLREGQEGGEAATTLSHRWHSPAGLPRSAQRLLDKGVVRSRTFLDLDVLPPYEGRALGEIVFLTGELRKGISPTNVLGALNNECRVSPLLFAEEGGRILILALGQVRASAARRTTLRRATAPVAATLDATLENVEITIEHTDSVRKLVDHRYDRLFPLERGEKEKGTGA